MDAAETKPEFCEKRLMSGACRSCGDHPGWVEFVFGLEVIAEPGMDLRGRKLEMEFSRLYAGSLSEKVWKLSTGGIERCPGCREANSLRGATLLCAFARRVWGCWWTRRTWRRWLRR